MVYREVLKRRRSSRGIPGSIMGRCKTGPNGGFGRHGRRQLRMVYPEVSVVESTGAIHPFLLASAWIRFYAYSGFVESELIKGIPLTHATAINISASVTLPRSSA